MHIKNLEIQGFKSYKDQAGVEDFSSKHNTVIGRNGSGKSNFFRAIQFVLCEKGFTSLTHKERTELLHEGSGSNVMTAYVQMVFDNSDGRFPFDAEEITLRRTIGLKKDEYFLNNKHFSKSDVINLLESAGFSRSNPYYIVQQGKVNALCLMKDEQRLELLKSVAGTTVYEERRRDSENIMKETDKKREKIEETVSYIEERLRELDEEKAELQAFRQLDRQKRALEYTLYDKELQKSTRQLETLDQSRTEEVERSNNASQEIVAAREAASSKKQEMKAIEIQQKQANQDKEALETERAELVSQKAKQELRIKDLEERSASSTDRLESSRAELAVVNENIKKIEDELETTRIPALDAAKNDLVAVQTDLKILDRKIVELQAKQGRSSQFENEEARNAYLQREIARVEKAKETKLQSQNQLREGIVKDEKLCETISKEISEIESEVQEKKQELSSITDLIKMLTKDRANKASQRKERQREEGSISRKVTEARNRVKNAERDLKRAMPGRVSQGIDGLDRIIQDLGERLRGRVYGPLYKLVEAEDERFNTAIEVAAGPQLAHVIVDTDETAAQLMTELQRRKLGRVTFKPLNVLDRRFRSKGESLHDIAGYEEQITSDSVAFPIVNKVKFNPPEIRNAVRAVLGRVMLCKDQQVARDTCREYRVNCVTLDGDEVNKTGTLSGGFRDKRTLVLPAVTEGKNAREELKLLENEQAKFENADSSFDREINGIKSQIDKLTSKRSHVERTYQLLADDFQEKEKQMKRAQKQVKESKPALEENIKGISDLDAELSTLQGELASPMLANLTGGEQEELAGCKARFPQCQKLLVTKQELADECEKVVSELKIELNSNLFRARDELIKTIRTCEQANVTSTSAVRQLESANEELLGITDRLNGSKNLYDELEVTSTKLLKKSREVKSALEELKTRESTATENLQQCEERIEKILTKRGVEKDNISGFAQRIRELGSLPNSELEKMKNMSIKKLMENLGKVNEEVKKYSHVNKKALDQFVNFSDQREALLKRKAELDDGQDQIKKLIKHLDRQKDEAIMRTFRGVAKNFREVFKELVPHGRGELVMVTASDNPQTSSGSSDDPDIREQVDQFVGVSPRVSFTGKGDVFRMRQLSGGQRALVALTLIFAIQRCDPAPFYLFDEIDQALDANHRRMVAALIKRQAASKESPTQFITTTFRPELVAVADKTYGIQFQNKVSSMQELKKPEAMEFINTIAAEEGGGQQSTRKRKPAAVPSLVSKRVVNDH